MRSLAIFSVSSITVLFLADLGGVTVAVVHPAIASTNHDVANDLLFRPRRLDLLPSLGADAVHVFQPGRFILDDIENLLPEIIHQLLGVNRPDALDHPTAQVFFDAFLGRRRAAGKHFRPGTGGQTRGPAPSGLGP